MIFFTLQLSRGDKMPIINILLAEGKPSEYIKSVADGVHDALMETWDIPLL